MVKKVAIVCGLAVVIVAAVVVCRSATRAGIDQKRYSELCRFGGAYKAAWTGKPRLLEQVAAALHFTSLTNYYRTKIESKSKVLLASGYFVQVSVPVSDLQAKVRQVRAKLAQVSQQTGAYYEAKLNWPSNEVLLVCRKQDVSLWQSALEKEAHQ